MTGEVYTHPNGLVGGDSTLYFTAETERNRQKLGRELWCSDQNGVRLVKDIHTGYLSSNPTSLTYTNGLLFFFASDANGTTRLWKSDGSAVTAISLPELSHFNYTDSSFSLTVFDGAVYFYGKGANGATGVWRTDGTNTVRLNAASSVTWSFGAGPSMAVTNGALYFTWAVFRQGRLYDQICRTTGSEPKVVWEQADGNLGQPGNLTGAEGSLYFTLGTAFTSGSQLWILANSGGAHRVPCQIDGTECNSVGNLTAIGERLFLAAAHPHAFDGRDVFVTEGESCQRLTAAEDADAGFLTDAGGRLFFTYKGPSTDRHAELWTSDGTVSGTKKVLGPNGDPFLYVNNLAFAGGELYFSGDLSETSGKDLGSEPWYVDLEPGISVSDTMVSEDKSSATFTVSLSAASEQTVTVKYATASVSALVVDEPTAKAIILVLAQIVTRDLRPPRQRDDAIPKELERVCLKALSKRVSLEDESYVCPADAPDAALTDPKKAAQELISIKDIAARLSERCKASGRLLVIDTCRDRTSNCTTGYVKNLEALERSTVGLWLMSSCSEGQYSCISDRIREGERHALFSRFIAEGLEGEADLLGDNDGDVSLFELYTYAFVKTRDASREIGHVQTPELLGLASPFTLTTTGNSVSRQTLTTSDPGMEASRSAHLLASDAVLKLRAADLEYRRTVSAANVSEATIEEASRILNRYICHLLGNQLHAALALDENCRLAWVARGLCYRTCGLYDRAFEAFQRGDEHFSLFVRAQTGVLNRYAAYDHRHGQAWRDENGNLVPRIQKTQEGARGYVGLFEHPGGEKPKYSVQRQQKVRISKIQAPWLYVDAIDDQEIVDGGWIHRDEVHWFPEAVDVYTPTSPMRSWGSGGAVDRLDYTSDGLYSLSEQLAQPAMAIEQFAIPFHRAGGAIGQASGVIGLFYSLPLTPAIANSPGSAAGYPGTVGGYIAMNDSYARIPSNYVARGDSFARIPGDYARVAQQWSGLANTYYLGQQREEQGKKARERLRDMGEPDLLEERPVEIVIPSPEERR